MSTKVALSLNLPKSTLNENFSSAASSLPVTTLAPRRMNDASTDEMSGAFSFSSSLFLLTTLDTSVSSRDDIIEPVRSSRRVPDSSEFDENEAITALLGLASVSLQSMSEDTSRYFF